MAVFFFWRNRRMLPLLLATLLASIAPAGPGGTSAQTPAASAPCDYYASPSGGGDGLTSSRPFRIQDFWAKAALGKTLCLLDGTYQGGASMIVPPVGKSGASGAPITIRALNDGGVFIDGQFAYYAFSLTGNNYWTFQGFDVGNSQQTNSIKDSHHVIVQRVTFSNTSMTFAYAGYLPNEHVFIMWGSSSTNNLMEDVGLFGTGRNTLLEFGGAGTNTYRRLWVRWEGYSDGEAVPPYNLGCPGPPFQIGYGSLQTSTFENVISVWNPEQIVPPNTCYRASSSYAKGTMTYGSTLIRDYPKGTSPGYTLRGWIMYGYDNPNLNAYSPWFMQAGGGDTGPTDSLGIDMQDMFVDARSQGGAPPFSIGCAGFGTPPCPKQRLNRLTAIRGTATTNRSSWSTFGLNANFNECTTLGECPNLYTGTSPGTGSRACFQYQNGALTSTPLWPWPMDLRIKAALARAKAAGRGGSPLAGSAGSFYAANTVTSEIVNRYGAIPPQCRTTRGPDVVSGLEVR